MCQGAESAGVISTRRHSQEVQGQRNVGLHGVRLSEVSPPTATTATATATATGSDFLHTIRLSVQIAQTAVQCGKT